MAPLLYFVLFLALFTAHSSALYCVCKTGVADQVLQKAIDYACGNGADCTPILQNGPCFQPNTVKDHCNYAVNSYYQRKANVQGSCDFAGAASTSETPPTTSSGCVYPSSPGSAGTTPSTGSPGTTPSTGTPGTTPGTGTGTGMGNGTGTGTGTTASSPNVFAISPTGTTTSGNNDNAAGLSYLRSTKTKLLLSLVLTFFLAFRV